jgi:molecular chaperone GrpE
MVCPINTKKILFENGPRLIIDYLVRYKGGDIKLSEEHDELQWLSDEEIEKNGEYKPWIKKLAKIAEEIIRSGEYLDAWKRCQADFENYKKRQAESQKDLVTYSNINLISEIIPVLDNFHASTEHIPEDQKENPWVTGIMHIQRQLETVLTDNGVMEIPIKKGDKFDPTVMEAIENKDCDPAKCKNIVSKVVMKGYKVGERVVRAGRVIVE